MTVVCKTAEDFLAALEEIAEEKITKAITHLQTEMAVFCFQVWTDGKATWSKDQPNDYWSGQYRASVNVSVSTPDISYAPDNPGEWPIHQSPYPAKDVGYIRGLLAEELTLPYSTVWISNSVPHAVKVEEHTQIAEKAAEFTRSHFVTGAVI